MQYCELPYTALYYTILMLYNTSSRRPTNHRYKHLVVWSVAVASVIPAVCTGSVGK